MNLFKNRLFSSPIAVVAILCLLVDPRWADAINVRPAFPARVPFADVFNVSALQARETEFPGFDFSFSRWRKIRSTVPQRAEIFLRARASPSIPPSVLTAATWSLRILGALGTAVLAVQWLHGGALFDIGAHVTQMSFTGPWITLAVLLRARLIVQQVAGVAGPRVELCDDDRSSAARAMNEDLEKLAHKTYDALADRSSGKADDAAIADAAGATDDYEFIHKHISEFYSTATPSVYFLSLPDKAEFFTNGGEYTVLHYDRERHAYYFSLNFLKTLKESSPDHYRETLQAFAEYTIARVVFEESREAALRTSGLDQLENTLGPLLHERLEIQWREEKEQAEAADESISTAERHALLKFSDGVKLVPSQPEAWMADNWALKRETAPPNHKKTKAESAVLAPSPEEDAGDKTLLAPWAWDWLRTKIMTLSDDGKSFDEAIQEWTLVYNYSPQGTGLCAYNHSISHAFHLVNERLGKRITLGPGEILDDRLPFKKSGQVKQAEKEYETRIKTANDQFPYLHRMLLLLNDPETVQRLSEEGTLSSEDLRQLKGFVRVVMTSQWYSKIDIFACRLSDADGRVLLSRDALERIIHAAGLMNQEKPLNARSRRRLLTEPERMRGTIGWASSQAAEGPRGNAFWWDLCAHVYSSIAETLSPFVFKVFTMRQVFTWLAQHDLPYAIKAADVQDIYAWGAGPDFLLRACNLLLPLMRRLQFVPEQLRFFMFDFAVEMLVAGARVHAERNIPLKAHRIGANLTDSMPVRDQSADLIESGIFGTLGEAENSEKVSKKIHFLLEANRCLRGPTADDPDRPGGILVLTAKNKPIPEELQNILSEFGFKVVCERSPRLHVPDEILRRMAHGENTQEAMNHARKQLTGGTYLIAVKTETLSEEKIRALREPSARSPLTAGIRSALIYDDSLARQLRAHNGGTHHSPRADSGEFPSLDYSEMDTDDRLAVLSREQLLAEYPAFEAALDGLAYAVHGARAEKKLSRSDEDTYRRIRGEWDHTTEFFSRDDVEWTLGRMERAPGSQLEIKSPRRKKKTTAPAPPSPPSPSPPRAPERSLWDWVMEQEITLRSVDGASIFQLAGRAPQLVDGHPVMPPRTEAPTTMSEELRKELELKRQIKERFTGTDESQLLAIVARLIARAGLSSDEERRRMIGRLLEIHHLSHIAIDEILEILKPFIPRTPQQENAWRAPVSTFLRSAYDQARLPADQWPTVHAALIESFGADAVAPLEAVVKRSMEIDKAADFESFLQVEEFLEVLNRLVNPRHLFVSFSFDDDYRTLSFAPIGDAIEQYRVPAFDKTLTVFASAELPLDPNETKTGYTVVNGLGLNENSNAGRLHVRPRESLLMSFILRQTTQQGSSELNRVQHWRSKAFGDPPATETMYRHGQRLERMRRLTVQVLRLDENKEFREGKLSKTDVSGSYSRRFLLKEKSAFQGLSSTQTSDIFLLLNEIDQPDSDPIASFYDFFMYVLSDAIAINTQISEANRRLLVEIAKREAPDLASHFSGPASEGQAESVFPLMERMQNKSRESLRALATDLVNDNFRSRVVYSSERQEITIEPTPTETRPAPDETQRRAAAVALDGLSRTGRGQTGPGPQRQRRIFDKLVGDLSPEAVCKQLRPVGINASPDQVRPILEHHGLWSKPKIESNGGKDRNSAIAELNQFVTNVFNGTLPAGKPWPQIWPHAVPSNGVFFNKADAAWTRVSQLPVSDPQRRELLLEWMSAMNDALGKEGHLFHAALENDQWTIKEILVDKHAIEYHKINGHETRYYKALSPLTSLEPLFSRQFGTVFSDANDEDVAKKLVNLSLTTEETPDHSFISLAKKTFSSFDSPPTPERLKALLQDTQHRLSLQWMATELEAQQVYRDSTGEDRARYDREFSVDKRSIPFAEKRLRPGSAAEHFYQAGLAGAPEAGGRAEIVRDTFVFLEEMAQSETPFFVLLTFILKHSRTQTGRSVLLFGLLGEKAGLTNGKLERLNVDAVLLHLLSLSSQQQRELAQAALYKNFLFEASVSSKFEIETERFPAEGPVPLEPELLLMHFQQWESVFTKGFFDKTTYDKEVAALDFALGIVPSELRQPSKELFHWDGSLTQDRFEELLAFQQRWQSYFYPHGYANITTSPFHFYSSANKANALLIPFNRATAKRVAVKGGQSISVFETVKQQGMSFDGVSYPSAVFADPQQIKEDNAKVEAVFSTFEKTLKGISSKLREVASQVNTWAERISLKERGISLARQGQFAANLSLSEMIVKQIAAESSAQGPALSDFVERHARLGSDMKLDYENRSDSSETRASAIVDVYKNLSAMTVPENAYLAAYLIIQPLFFHALKSQPIPPHTTLLINLISKRFPELQSEDPKSLQSNFAKLSDLLANMSPTELSKMASDILRENFDVLIHFNSPTEIEIERDAPAKAPTSALPEVQTIFETLATSFPTGNFKRIFSVFSEDTVLALLTQTDPVTADQLRRLIEEASLPSTSEAIFNAFGIELPKTYLPPPFEDQTADSLVQDFKASFGQAAAGLTSEFVFKFFEGASDKKILASLETVGIAASTPLYEVFSMMLDQAISFKATGKVNFTTLAFFREAFHLQLSAAFARGYLLQNEADSLLKLTELNSGEKAPLAFQEAAHSASAYKQASVESYAALQNLLGTFNETVLQPQGYLGDIGNKTSEEGVVPSLILVKVIPEQTVRYFVEGENISGSFIQTVASDVAPEIVGDYAINMTTSDNTRIPALMHKKAAEETIPVMKQYKDGAENLRRGVPVRFRAPLAAQDEAIRWIERSGVLNLTPENLQKMQMEGGELVLNAESAVTLLAHHFWRRSLEKLHTWEDAKNSYESNLDFSRYIRSGSVLEEIANTPLAPYLPEGKLEEREKSLVVGRVFSELHGLREDSLARYFTGRMVTLLAPLTANEPLNPDPPQATLCFLLARGLGMDYKFQDFAQPTHKGADGIQALSKRLLNMPGWELQALAQRLIEENFTIALEFTEGNVIRVRPSSEQSEFKHPVVAAENSQTINLESVQAVFSRTLGPLYHRGFVLPDEWDHILDQLESFFKVPVGEAVRKAERGSAGFISLSAFVDDLNREYLRRLGYQVSFTPQDRDHRTVTSWEIMVYEIDPKQSKDYDLKGTNRKISQHTARELLPPSASYLTIMPYGVGALVEPGKRAADIELKELQRDRLLLSSELLNEPGHEMLLWFDRGFPGVQEGTTLSKKITEVGIFRNLVFISALAWARQEFLDHPAQQQKWTDEGRELNYLCEIFTDRYVAPNSSLRTLMESYIPRLVRGGHALWAEYAIHVFSDLHALRRAEFSERTVSRTISGFFKDSEKNSVTPEMALLLYLLAKGLMGEDAPSFEALTGKGGAKHGLEISRALRELTSEQLAALADRVLKDNFLAQVLIHDSEIELVPFDTEAHRSHTPHPKYVIEAA